MGLGGVLRGSGDKRLNAMDRLGDMGHFPLAVNAGATLNVLLTMVLTWLVEPRWPALVAVWLLIVLTVNLLPVLLLRLTLTPRTTYPTLRQMNFFRDQHKFSDWVYLAASADMVFWILLCWTVRTFSSSLGVLLGLLAVAALATSSPVLLRWMTPSRADA